MSLDELLAELSSLGVFLEVHGDRLRYRPRGLVSPDLRNQLIAHKTALMQHVQSGLWHHRRQAGESAPSPYLEESPGYNYEQSTRRWVAAGCPLRSVQDARYVLATKCKTCGHYVSRGPALGVCRYHKCYLSASCGTRNKLRRATEHCDIGAW